MSIMTNSENKHYYSKINKNLKIISKVIGILLLFYFAPIITVKYYELNGYEFDKSVGYISENIYNINNINNNNDVLFDKEITIKLHYITIDESRYGTIYSTNELFEIGLQSDSINWGLNNFNSFEFIHGNPFNNQNEIVISKSISNELFNKTNSINEELIINNISYTVVGIIDEKNELMNSIFFMNSNIEAVQDRDWTFFTYIIFYDENLHLKLYERGGMDLIIRTTTFNNQRNINFTTNMLVYGIFIFTGVLNLILKKPKNNQLDNEDKNNKNQSMLKSFIQQNIFITLFLIYFLLAAIILYSAQATLKVGLMHTISQVPNFYFVFLIYLIPIVIYIIKSSKKTDS